MIKFKLSKNIFITGLDDFNPEDIPPQYRQGYYILYDAAGEKDFLINETIKYFIDKFNTPKTEAEVVQEIEGELQSSSKEIEETCSGFFKFLCKRKIVVPEDKNEQDITSDPLYKEGDCLGGWQIVEVLSSRQYVDIYLAADKNTGSASVIKLLNRNKIRSRSTFEQELTELEREYTLLQNVNHIPSVNHAYGFYKEPDSSAYIILEYIRGKSVSRFLREAETLTEEDCLQIMNNILQAFSLLHQNKLIHGDIHSNNLLIAEDKTVTIIDLGLSRNMKTEKDEVQKFGGVNFYMPPERINSTSIQKYTKEPDLASDVYQIGLLLYLVLYNTLPFKGFIWEELAQHIKEGTVLYPDTSFCNYPVPGSLIRMVKKCLSKDPAERYSDAMDIWEDFKKHAFEPKEHLVN